MTSSAEASKRGWAWPNCVVWVRHTLIISRREEIWVWGEKKKNYWNICLRKSNRLHTTVQLIVPEVCLMICKNARGKSRFEELCWSQEPPLEIEANLRRPKRSRRSSYGMSQNELPFAVLFAFALAPLCNHENKTCPWKRSICDRN